MTMKKLRWAFDGDFWELDLSTPATLDGVARPVFGSGHGGAPLLLGLSRGARLSRPKQIDFLQRFMAAPLVPSFSDGVGLSLQRLLSLPLPLPSSARDASFTTLLGQFNVQKFAASLRRKGLRLGASESESSFLQSIRSHLSNPHLYGLNFCSEWWMTPQDTLLLTSEANADYRRNKAVLHHKFPNHNLTVDASSPALFVDHLGNYWDVPFTLAMDMASIAPPSWRFCINHNTGSPRLLRPHPLSQSASPRYPPLYSLVSVLSLPFQSRKACAFGRVRLQRQECNHMTYVSQILI